MKEIIAILILTVIIGCQTEKKNLTTYELILSDLQEEYVDNSEQKEIISNSIIILSENDNFVIATVSFQSILNGEFKAQLFVVQNELIMDKIERLNYKYHAGVFELSNNFQNIDTEIIYKILLPTSSVPHVVKLHEYLEIDTHKKIVPLFEFYAEERYCIIEKERGELIKRKVFFKNGGYVLIKKVYDFDCADFEFEKEIENLNFLSQEGEKLRTKKNVGN